MNRMLQATGEALARYLAAERNTPSITLPTPPEKLLAQLRPADVLLVEGHSRISAAVKFLTNSAWSHAALYVGALGAGRLEDAGHLFVEADVVAGVRSVGLAEFQHNATRICRPVGLTEAERQTVCDHVIARLGQAYDLRNVWDLARYMLPEPPVPRRMRRRLMSLGSGDPTRAICSTLIAEAFGAIGYPILPEYGTRVATGEDGASWVEEEWHIRHHSLYAPRDFDLSPYFQVVKPTVEGGFDFHRLPWGQRALQA